MPNPASHTITGGSSSAKNAALGGHTSAITNSPAIDQINMRRDRVRGADRIDSTRNPIQVSTITAVVCASRRVTPGSLAASR